MDRVANIFLGEGTQLISKEIHWSLDGEYLEECQRGASVNGGRPIIARLFLSPHCIATWRPCCRIEAPRTIGDMIHIREQRNRVRKVKSERCRLQRGEKRMRMMTSEKSALLL